jgi:hypothetical protein
MRDKFFIDCELLCLCSPRSGSASLAQYLNFLGLDIGHEILKKSGIVSWWNSYNESGGEIYFCRQTGLYFKPKTTIRLLRQPQDCISSLVLENEFRSRDNVSFKYRSFVINQIYNINISTMKPIQCAIYSYLYWNEIIESMNNIYANLRIERINQDINKIKDKFTLSLKQNLEKPDVLNKSINKFGTHPKKISNKEIQNSIKDQQTSQIYAKYTDMYYMNN